MIGLLPFEYNRTNNRNNAPIPNTIAAATMIKQKQLWTTATLPFSDHQKQREAKVEFDYPVTSLNKSSNT